MITIHNMRYEKPHYPFDVRVDRSSILGNPYILKYEKDRDIVCDKYKIYFNNNIHTFKYELDRILSIYRKEGKLCLYCWCYPLRCHAETIKDYLLTL